MRRHFRIGFLLALLSLVSLYATLSSNVPQSEAAFGTSPPWVKNDHMLPGTTFEQVIKLSRDDTSEEFKVTSRITGDKMLLKWITIQDEKDLVMKAGESILPIKVIVNVPKQAAIRSYVGGIFVALAPSSGDGDGGEVAISLGAHIAVNITVTGDKITDYNVKSITADPLNEGDPLHLNVEVQNLGNTDIIEPPGQIDIYNSNNTDILKSLTFVPLPEAVSPNETVKSVMVFKDLVLDPGDYWIVVKATKNDKVIYENRLFEEVKAKVIPVITPEATVAKKPSLPKVTEEVPTPATSPETVPAVTSGEVAPAPAETPAVTSNVTQPAPAVELKPSAPELAQSTNIILIFGLAGLGFGLIAMIGVIIALVMVIRNQRQANLERYLASRMKDNEP
jgi:preprotein translocase subunit Sss1